MRNTEPILVHQITSRHDKGSGTVPIAAGDGETENTSGELTVKEDEEDEEQY